MPDLTVERPGEQQSDMITSEISPLRERRLEDQFADHLTPEESGWAQMGNDITTQPQTAQKAVQQLAATSTVAEVQPTQAGPASRQIQRIKAGQQLLPVDDHCNYDHDNHDHDNQDRNHDHSNDNGATSSSTTALDRVHKGKRPLNKQIGDIWWDNSSDPWQSERQQMLQMMENMRTEYSSRNVS